MRFTLVHVVAICAGLGLLGPAIRALLWPPSAGGFAGSGFVASVVILLWPLQILGNPEQEGIMNLRALGMATGNAALFAVGGFIVGITSRRPFLNGGIALAGVVLLLLWARVTVGFTFGEAWLALSIAAMVYSCPFLLSRRIVWSA